MCTDFGSHDIECFVQLIESVQNIPNTAIRTEEPIFDLTSLYGYRPPVLPWCCLFMQVEAECDEEVISTGMGLGERCS